MAGNNNCTVEESPLPLPPPQPPPQPPTTLTGTIGRKLDNIERESSEGWTNQIFDCCKTPEQRDDCGLACCCPCFMQRRISAERDGGDGIRAEKCGCIFFGLSMYCGLCFCVVGAFQFISRRRTRERLDRPGSCLTDAICSCCCSPCEMTQEHLELVAAKESGEVETDEKGKILPKKKQQAAVEQQQEPPEAAKMLD